MSNIHLEPIGEFVQNEKWDEKYDSKNRIAVPFLDGQTIDFELVYYPDDTEFLNDAQKLLNDFFQLTSKNRSQISKYVWQNCQEFLEAVEYDEMDAPLHDIQQADEIWQFVSPTSAQIMRDDDIGKLSG